MNTDKGHILIADSKSVYTRALQSLLEGHNYEVLVVQDGQTAIELAANRETDLILLGVEMSSISGYEVCRRIRAFSTAPIIMLNTQVNRGDILTGLEAGADDVMSKFFDIEEFLIRIQSVLHSARLAMHN